MKLQGRRKRGTPRAKSEIRSSKSETNSKCETQNQKPPSAEENQPPGGLFETFEFWFLNLFRISDFVLRI
jgi:hypothetical protein